ncbi:MAG: DUF3034 family protein [Xanthomonadales bacterium]|nr:DUF3034 family protein [Xanthomonadales bacterium]
MLRTILAAALLTSATAALAAGGKLLGTGGVTQFEGAAGGGLTPWALITGNGTQDEIGASAHATYLTTSDYQLASAGVGVGFYDRLEISLARQRLDVDRSVVASTAGALVGGLEPILGPPGNVTARSTDIEMDIIGAKLRLFGDAVHAQDSLLPQVSLGVQHKRNRDFDRGVDVPYLGNVGVPALLGARDDSGTDYYLSATKVFLGIPAGRNLLLNATLRATRANAFGLLGFGREVVNPLNGELLDRDDGYELEYGLAAALFVHPNVVVGAEYRSQSSRLDNQPVLGLLGAPRLAREDDAWDAFVAWLPNKYVSVTGAYVDLGNLPFQPDSRAAYLSLKFSY